MIIKSAAKRLPWLISLLFLGLAVSGISREFEGVVDELPMLVAFQPVVLGMAGNAGTQSLGVTLRELAGNKIKKRHMLICETRIAFLEGLAVGAVSFFTVSLFLTAVSGYPKEFAMTAAFCLGAATAFSMTVSGLTGTAIPMILRRFGADPAVASGPLITTVSDLCAVISYYSLAWILLIE